MCTADIEEAARQPDYEDSVLPPECFPTGMPDDFVSVLSRWARHLLASLPDTEECNPPQVIPSAYDLYSVSDWMSKEKIKIGEFYVAAMLCSGRDDSVMDRLAAHVLAAALYDRQHGKKPGVGRRACRNVRLMYEGERPDLRNLIENLEDLPSAGVYRWLKDKRRQARSDSYDALGRLISVLRHYVEHKYTNRTDPLDPARHESAVEVVAESEIARARTLHFHNDNQEGGYDPDRARIDVEPSGGPNKEVSLDAQRSRAKSTRAQIVRGYMMSPCRWGVLSRGNLSQLVQALMEGTKSGDKAYALLAISLLTGRSAYLLNELNVKRGSGRKPASDEQKRERLVSAERLINDRAGLRLRTRLTLAPPHVKVDHLEYFEPSQSVLYLPLPAEIAACLKNTAAPIAPRASIEDRLRRLHNRIPQITEARIRSAGHLWLYHDGNDRTVLNRLFGTNLAHAVPLYYENMAESTVLNAYEKWVRHLNGFLGDSPFTVRMPRRGARIGSRRTPKLEVVKRKLSDYRRFVVRSLGLRMGSAEAHNHYAVYTFLLLSLATGLRPSRQAFETFADFCDGTRTYYIQDKDVGQVASPRYVAVADFGVRQLNYYRAYLSRLIMHLRNPIQRDYIEAAINRQVPYLFLLGKDADKPEPLAPSTISPLLEEHLPLELNWPRHLLRTHLIERGEGDDVVQAFLGHGEMGQEPFARYSGLTMKDLESVAMRVDELAGERKPDDDERLASSVSRRLSGGTDARAIDPLDYAPRGAKEIPLGRMKERKFPYEARRKANERRRTAGLAARRARGRNWVDHRLRDIEQQVDRLRNQSRARTWHQETMHRLDEDLKDKYVWTSAREYLPIRLNAINEEHGTAIPVPAPPRLPQWASLMHDEKTFEFRKTVHYAAERFLEALEDRGRVRGIPDQDFIPLILFSAASFGALADPRALLGFGRALQANKVRPNIARYRDRRDLCWVDFRFKTNRSSNIMVNEEPWCLRRFFVDGTTLILLLRYLKRPMSAIQRYRHTSGLMTELRDGLRRLCGERLLPARMSLRQFCNGAVGVVESQPGVELPHYLVEYANGRIDSVSLPEPYFLAYINANVPGLAADAIRAPIETRPVGSDQDDEVPIDPNVALNIKKVRELFVDLPKHDKSRLKREVLERIDRFLSEPLSEYCLYLGAWFKYLLVEKGRASMTPARYSSWISRQWLLEFEGIDLKKLEPGEWADKYEAIVEKSPEDSRNFVAGRLMSFHLFLVSTKGVPHLPVDLRGLYEGRRFVRARVISERHFALFIQKLTDLMKNDENEESIEWIFVLCYRLGARIGEISRLRLRDIEDSSDPLVKFRATRFGNTKSKTPHQLPLDRFLTGGEKEAFHPWLRKRRRLACGDDSAPVFAPAGTQGVIWDTRSLARLFTKITYEVTGLHYSPHACRHSLASKLIWYAEGEIPPDGTPFTEVEQRQLKEAVFTSAPKCRDRIWHLSSVFNHSEPSTTFQHYIHFADWLIYERLRLGQRRIAAVALCELLDVGIEDAGLSNDRVKNGVLIEQVLPIAYKLAKGRFSRVGFKRGRPEGRSPGTSETRTPGKPDRFRYLQPILEDLEKGQDPEGVALLFDVDLYWVEAVFESAKSIAETKTKKGVPRLFSRKRTESDPNLLVPYRLRNAEDRGLYAELTSALRNQYERDESSIRFACDYWLRHTVVHRHELPFHTQSDLKSFLRTFCEVAADVIPLMNEADEVEARNWWLVSVWTVPTKTYEEQQDAWQVFPGLHMQEMNRTRAGIDWYPNSSQHPNGIAYLRLVKLIDGPNDAATTISSKALGCVLHEFNVVVGAEDLHKKRLEESSAVA